MYNRRCNLKFSHLTYQLSFVITVSFILSILSAVKLISLGVTILYYHTVLPTPSSRFLLMTLPSLFFPPQPILRFSEILLPLYRFLPNFGFNVDQVLKKISPDDFYLPRSHLISQWYLSTLSYLQ